MSPPSYRAQLAPATTIEEMLTAYLESDATLMALATGGVYPYTSLSNEGITRDATPEAYDGDGYIQPIIIVKARAPIPDTRIADIKDKVVGVSQAMEFWVYQDMAYDIIEQIVNRIFFLLHGHTFQDFWPMQWIYTTGSLMDDAGLSGSRMVRTDFMAKKIRRAA
jgi:hypothetical protein